MYVNFNLSNYMITIRDEQLECSKYNTWDDDLKPCITSRLLAVNKLVIVSMCMYVYIHN